MPKMKMHRKSTSIDMTAMCDVAFLLLSFFIFTAKFKKSEEVAIVTPASVSTDSLAVFNRFNIYMNISPEGNVLVGLENDSIMNEFGKELNTRKALGLTPLELEAFSKKTSMGVPFKDLKTYLTGVTNNQTGLAQAGIPVKDSLTAELGDWIDATAPVYLKGKEYNNQLLYNIFIKADKKTPYEVVDKVMQQFVKKGFDQFKLVTTPLDVPMGTPLYESNKAAKNAPAK